MSESSHVRDPDEEDQPEPGDELPPGWEQLAQVDLERGDGS